MSSSPFTHMGILVSRLSSSSASDDKEQHAQTPNVSRARTPPQYIALPPPMFNLSSSASPSRVVDDPLASPMYSPGLEMYHTAPSTPFASPSIEVPSAAARQRAPESPAAKLHIAIPPATANDTHSDLPVEDAFPRGEIPIDLVDDEGLSALEKIYLFARSPSVIHRLFIVHALPSFLQQVTPQEAIEYVLPLIPCLAIDEDEKVKEALVTELVHIIWWFFTHCQVIPDPLGVEETVYSSSTSTISVQAFTPILGTLLLSPNSKVGGGARYVVVNILAQMRDLDKRESGVDVSSLSPLPSGSQSDSEDEEDLAGDIPVGLFGREERLMFEQELVQQVVIGMGRLDMEDDVDMDATNVTEEPAQDARHIADRRIQIVGVDENSNHEYAIVPTPEPVKVSPSEGVTSYFPSYSVPSPGSSDSSTPSSLADTSSSSSASPSAFGSPSSLSRTMDASSVSYAQSPLRQEAIQPRSSAMPTSRPSNPPLGGGSPSVENPPNPPAASRRSSPRQTVYTLSAGTSEAETDENGLDGADDGEGDQAAVGRLSSMSLMAAVTANGCIDDTTKEAFVKEIKRAGHDPVYWVRREASYALGALAKVVPDEIVLMSLLPLFDTLRRDSQWHVRHSALFALPAILSRLKPAQRRTLALDVILPLSTDESQAVRSGALESLGEVLYTFHEDPDGPPEELVQLFLGRREDRRVRDGQQAVQDREQILNSLFGRPTNQAAAPGAESPLTSFYTDPARPLICAFNYPAVALTLGREQWGSLRQTYLEIADNRDVSVRRTLAASLGELAKIIGAENAERDLLGVWWDAVRSEVEELRERALKCVEEFAGALSKKARIEVVSGLLSLWQEGTFLGWRERKTIARALTGLATSMGRDDSDLLRSLFRMALGDGVAAVREAAISGLPYLWSMFADQEGVLAGLREDVRKLSQSEVYRHRATFVACLQALLASSLDSNFIASEDALWTMVPDLADDAVVGVRIGIARLVQFASEQPPNSRQPFLLDLIRHLSLDSSPDVRAYVRHSLNAASPVTLAAASVEAATARLPRRPKFATFSRPPLAPSLYQSTYPTSLHPSIAEYDINQRLTGSATEDTGESALSNLRSGNTPQEGSFSPVPTSSEFLPSQSDLDRTVTVPA